MIPSYCEESISESQLEVTCSKPYPNHKCLTIVSTFITAIFYLVDPHLDVEHAAEDSGKQVQHAPQLHYEGFEPSSYDKNDARAEIDEGLVRIVCSLN